MTTPEQTIDFAAAAAAAAVDTHREDSNHPTVQLSKDIMLSILQMTN